MDKSIVHLFLNIFPANLLRDFTIDVGAAFDEVNNMFEITNPIFIYHYYIIVDKSIVHLFLNIFPANLLRDFTIDVGTAFDEVNNTFDPADFTTVATIRGSQPAGALTFDVQYVGPRRYLKIHIRQGTDNRLVLCEVELMLHSF